MKDETTELTELIREIRKTIPEENMLLFRGESKLYEKMLSGKARPDSYIIPEVENGWNTIVSRIADSKNDIKFKQAILQHYGFPTYYLDFTSDPIIAAWFACNECQKLSPILWVGNTFRDHNETTYSNIPNGIGYIKVLEILNYNNLIENNELFDIAKENVFLRPQKQNAFLMLHQPPRLPNPNKYVIKVIEIDTNATIQAYLSFILCFVKIPKANKPSNGP
jgi:hypothetical protein